MVFTFWEGSMPDYIKLCMKTWKFDYTLLDYNNINQYTDLDISTLRYKNFSLPQIADCVRAHLLRDNGGYWLDTDTIVLGDLPKETMIGYPEKREQSIGYLYAEKPNMPLFTEWARFQDNKFNQTECPRYWSVFGNDFTDWYCKEHPDVSIAQIENSLPETYLIEGDIPRWQKYRKFYFNTDHHISELKPTNFVMLHNSWTPNYYKKLSADEVLSQKCTLSNILNEVI